MSNPASIADTPLHHQPDLMASEASDARFASPEETEYATLTEALEQTVFENFDDGLYIGMMSGTSLDGMDAVLCQFRTAPDTESSSPMHVLASYDQDFPARLREVLLALCQPDGVQALTPAAGEPTSELDWFGWASREYGEFASDVVTHLLKKADVDAELVLAIGCHGQTVRHRPQMGFSLQLLDANIIAERTGISVVSDFRRRDMAVGGQGAPLVPAFHQAMFAAPDHTRVLLNLGGIANITVLPAASSESSNPPEHIISGVVGYDTGPANLLLDAWTLLHTGKEYDAAGTWAQSGQIIEPLLHQLLAHPFFARPYPKSTGREDFNLAWLQDELQKYHQTTADTHLHAADVQATLTELTAISASMQIKRLVNAHERGSVYVCGGGALNHYLMTRLQAHIPHCTVETTTGLGMNPMWVEAVAFAWLAQQTLMGETGNLPAVTGARKDVVLGQVCFA